MRRFLDWVMGIAEMLGGPGLFLLAFLDSSFLSFPQVVDILMVGLVARHPERLLWYAAMPALGSIAGSYVIFTLARRGGDAFLRRRLHERHIDRAFAVLRKYGLLVVMIASILPPPMPFKIFILTAGAARVRPVDFLIAISIGRGARYLLEGILAAWYGEAALRVAETFMREHTLGVVIGLTVLAGALAFWIWWSRRSGRFDSNAGSSV